MKPDWDGYGESDGNFVGSTRLQGVVFACQPKLHP